MLVLNKNTQAIQIDLSRFQELNFQGKKFINVLDEKEGFNWKDQLTLKKKGAFLFHEKK